MKEILKDQLMVWLAAVFTTKNINPKPQISKNSFGLVKFVMG